MSTLARKGKSSRRPATEQRLLLHNITWDEYEALGRALQDRAGLRLTYDRGTLEIMSTSSPPAPHAWTSDAQRFLFHFVSWEDYETILKALDAHHLRITYDRGDLEIMTLSSEHERHKSLLKLFLQVMVEEFRVPGGSLGSTTYRRRDLQKGLEADDCFYFENWPKVRGKKRINMATDPAPDLALEVDVTHSSLKRLAIYAALRVGEVWRFDGESLRVCRLNASFEYEECERSAIFPLVPLGELARWLLEGANQNDFEVVPAFREWIKGLLTKKRNPKKP